MTRDMLRIMAQEKSHVSISSHMVAEPVFVHGNTVAGFGEPPETDGEALVAERRARRRTAEIAQQVVRTRPAGVDVEEIGRLEMFSGDGELNGRVNSMPWSQWSLTVRSHCGELNQTATRLLQRVETNVEHPIIADNTTMTEWRDDFPEQLYCVLELTCRKRALQVVQKFPEVTGSRHGDACAESLDSILW